MKVTKRNTPRRGTPSSQGSPVLASLRAGSIDRRRSQRGVALVAVLIAIAIILVISNQFGTSTSTDMIAAGNYRDQMRAHFLARSAQNLGELVIHIQRRLDNIKELRGQVQITDFADQLILPFCGGGDEVKDMIGFSADQVPGLGAEIGTCGFNGPFITEDDKINVNCANTRAMYNYIEIAVEGLMFFQAYDPVFEEADAEGWRRDRKQQAAAILDYIDKDTSHLDQNGTTEDYGYESLRDRYQAKNNYIDTVGELKLVRGVDDRFWSLFGNAFTAYGGCKINLSALSNPQLIAALLSMSAKNPQDPVLQDPRKLFILAGVVAKARQFGETFTKPDFSDFAEFVKDPVAAIGALSGTGGIAGAQASGAASANLGIPPGEKIGMEIDPRKLQAIATVGPRRVYRIEAYGEVERKQKNKDGSPVFPPIRKTITGVFDVKTVPQNVRKQPAPNGAWLFLRED